MYDVRDLLGHFVKPRAKAQAMCPHQCCKNRRPHPNNWPVMLDRAALRRASDDELVQHMQREKVGANGRAVSQVVRELDRRETAEKRAHARKARAAGRRQDRAQAYRDYLESEWVRAESATRGQMVNKRGRAAGIDPRSLWTADNRTRAAYASVELRQYWDAHPIVSASEFRGGAAAQARGARERQESRLYGVY